MDYVESTRVDPDGSVHCPKCGATSFASQRSWKEMLGVGVFAKKRLKCNGCGKTLKSERD